MEGVGVVVTSERKSKAEAGVEEAQALVLLVVGTEPFDASFFVVLAV